MARNNKSKSLQSAPHTRTGAKRLEFRAEVQEFKRQRILEEARDLFFDQGYDATTLDAIAASLNVTKPFLYSYFKNKSDILSAICEIGIARSIEAFDEALAMPLGPAEKLRLIVEKVTTIIILKQKYIVVYQRQDKNLEPPAAKHLLNLRRDFDLRLARLLEEGAARGVFEIENAAMTAVSISGLITWVASWYRPGRHVQTDVVMHTIRLVERMVIKRPSK